MWYQLTWLTTNVTEAWAETQVEATTQVFEKVARMQEATQAGGVFDTAEDPSELAEAYEAMLEVSKALDRATIAGGPSYLLSIWQMALCRELMAERGMLDLEAEPPPWPNPHAYDLEGIPITTWDGFPDGSPEQRLYAAAEHTRTAAAPRIPAYKLSGPQGWVVTPPEIRASLGQYETWLREDETRDSNLAEQVLRPGGLSDFEQLYEDVLFMRGRPVPMEYRVQVGLEWWPVWLSFLDQAATRGGGFNVAWAKRDDDDHDDDMFFRPEE